jgi:hypothetical protein
MANPNKNALDVAVEGKLDIKASVAGDCRSGEGPAPMHVPELNGKLLWQPGNLCALTQTHGFASPSHDGFALFGASRDRWTEKWSTPRSCPYIAHLALNVKSFHKT